MKCPICGVITKDSRVLDSRQVGNTIKRRRECEACKGRWNTFEVLEDEYVTERNKHRYIGWTSGETHTLVKLYQQDLSKTEIARLLGRSRMSVSRKLDKLMASGEYFDILNVVS